MSPSVLFISAWVLSASRLRHVGLAGAYALVGTTVLGLLFTWWSASLPPSSSRRRLRPIAVVCPC